MPSESQTAGELPAGPPPRVAVLGGGLAGIAATAALAAAGYSVDLYESRAFLGGRATSWPVTPNDGDSATSEMIDNCQHILLRCCVNLLDLYARLDAKNKIHFYREFYFIEPGGRTSILKGGILPAPAHFAGSFLGLKFLGLRDKIGIARAIRAIPRERRIRQDLESISMLDWLREKRQTPAAIERYWRQVLVSAVNEELDLMAASHGLQVFWLGMIAHSRSYEMGVPAVPLRDLYDEFALRNTGRVSIHHRSAVTAIHEHNGRIEAIETAEGPKIADYYVSCLPFERLQPLGLELPIDWSAFTHSPITGIHLWFDRAITNLPHATLLDRTVQWMFNKDSGHYIQLVVSASRDLVAKSRADIIQMAVAELAEFFPAAKTAVLVKAQVIKEVRATFSARPNLEQLRPLPITPYPNFFLAGDWTRSGWPATMEGAVRSGYFAAEAVTLAAGAPRSFVLPDLD